MEGSVIKLEIKGVEYSLVATKKKNNYADHDYAYEHLTHSIDIPGEEIVKEEFESQAQGFTWNNSKCLLLLDEYASRRDQFRDPRIKNKLLWEEMVASFKKKGYCVTNNMLDKKFRNMKQTYMRIKESQNTGKTTGTAAPIKWAYYQQMEDIFSLDESNISVSPAGPSTTRQDSEDSISSPFNGGFSDDCNAENEPNIYTFRKEQLKIEKKKVEAIKEFKKALDTSNELLSDSVQVQRQRNRLLEEYLKKM